MPTPKTLATDLEPVAKDTLAAFDTIAQAAQAELNFISGAPTDVLANTSNSTFTSPPLASRLIAEGHRKLRTDAELILREPAIARVVCHDGEKECITYICRAAPPSVAGMDLVSQRAPKGRLAALSVGDTLTLPNGRAFVVLSRMEVHPEQIEGAWDSKNSVLRFPSRRPVTIESLAALLGTTVTTVQDLLSQLVAEENRKDLIREGQKRSILTSMQLRDQAVLDANQDEIFRLPVDEQIFLSGPPGSGKTTTLIRRLGQKLDVRYLSDNETQKVRNASSPGSPEHASSWIMFTPTELLRQYVKEAFNRERVPASDQHIKTWDEFRRDASRNTFRILRSAVKRSFVLRASANTLGSSAATSPKEYFEDFNSWQRKLLLEGIEKAATALEAMHGTRAGEVGKQLKEIINKNGLDSLADLLIAVERLSEPLRAISDEYRALVNTPIEGALNKRLNRDRNFIPELSTFLQNAVVADDTDSDEGLDDEDEEEEETSSSLVMAVNAYKSALRASARAHVLKRKVSAGTRNSLVLERIGKNELDDSQIENIGAAILVLGHTRHLLSAIRKFVFDVPKRYRVFRRIRQREERWFAADAPLGNDISEPELDAMLLSSLRAARDLLSRLEVRVNLTNRSWVQLQPIFALYRNQVLADEATDFSPLQLACMACLMHPAINSFFASGDFNQRLNPSGIANVIDLSWVSPNIQTKEISVLFRQSRRLQAFSQSILNTLGNVHARLGVAADIEGNEVPAALFESHGDHQRLAGWLADRIREIERSLGQLPSVAVFVASERDVEPLSDALNVELSENSLQAVACIRGQIKGQDTDVRVFDVRHVKGLEFEAAFFTGIDVLARDIPTEFARYLYVGATRAATYLGITCEGQLPSLIEPLRNQFDHDWSVGPQ